MTSGKVQLSENAAVKFFGDFSGKFRKLQCIFFIWTTGSKLPENGVFSNSSDRRHTNKSATFKSILQFGQSIIPLPIAINTIQDHFRPITRNLEPLNGNLRNPPGKRRNRNQTNILRLQSHFSISQQTSTSQTSPPRLRTRISATFFVPTVGLKQML